MSNAKELINITDLFENDDYVIFETVTQTNLLRVASVEVSFKDDGGDIISIQTVCSKVIG